MKRILVGFIMDGNTGGLDRYLLNFLETVWEEGIQIDLLTNHADRELKQRLSKYHSHLYEIANLHHPIKQFRQVSYLIQKNQYETVYLNISTAIDCVAALAAKKCNVPRRILHCHASGNDCSNALVRLVFNSIHRFCRLFLYRTGTEFYGASKLAGEWAFPKKVVLSDRFHVIVSGIDTKKYIFDKKIRDEVRSKLGLENAFVIGHAGTFTYVKNHGFLIQVFREILKKEPSAVLLLLGTGDNFEKIRKQVEKLGIEESVRLLGWRNDTEQLLQAMDVFVLPSHFEGLSIVSLEAQAAGLCCILSDKVPEEAKISRLCYFLPLKQGAKKWADFILAHREYSREEVKIDTDSGLFDLNAQKAVLKRIIGE